MWGTSQSTSARFGSTIVSEQAAGSDCMEYWIFKASGASESYEKH